MPYSVSEPENEYFNYKFRSCAKEDSCEPFYEVHDEVDRNICKNDLNKSDKRLNTNRRLGELFEKHFAKSEEGEGYFSEQSRTLMEHPTENDPFL